ncbi:diacylglycerol kinase family protein [uncultured Actinomyces sp.]|uniref:diacylglycerol kinase family protein n=1 Tax=uncultured Actinomyces sp. TaxID=249061 RepID=UPI0028DCE9F5|nr:diacylglycerol kinase family protein [uncultured Actinomyces sp.]
MSTSATASAAPSYPASPSPAPRRRRWHLEDYVLVASCLGFVVWTALVGAGATGWLDHLRPSRLAPRSVPGQIYEAVSLATHPVIVFTAIGVAALVAYKRRMRRLAVALAATFITPAVGTAVSMWLSRTRPASAFADSISHQGYAYPAAHVVAVTIASWVLVTLTRAQRRPTSNIWAGSLLGVLVVLATCASQWLMGLSRISDILGGLLLGSAGAAAALRIGGIQAILASWGHLGLASRAVDRRAAIILNPTKLDDLSLLRRRVDSEVLSAGWRPTVWLETTAEDPGHAAARAALDAGVDLVLVAGGDGTVRVVASELAGTGVSMALLPSGTGNLLARNLSVPLDTDAALRLALTGRPRRIDVVTVSTDAGTPESGLLESGPPGDSLPGSSSTEAAGSLGAQALSTPGPWEADAPGPRVTAVTSAEGPGPTGPDAKGPSTEEAGTAEMPDASPPQVVAPRLSPAADGATRFAVMAGLGLDAQIMEDTNDGLKKVIRAGAYAVAAVQNAVPDPFTLTLRIDGGEPTTHQAVMALVGNVGTITRGMTLFPRAVPDDGVIDLLLANPSHVVSWAKLGTGLLTGMDVEGLDFFRARSIEMTLDRPVPFELDGDTAGVTRHLAVRVEPGVLSVIAP